MSLLYVTLLSLVLPVKPSSDCGYLAPTPTDTPPDVVAYDLKPRQNQSAAESQASSLSLLHPYSVGLESVSLENQAPQNRLNQQRVAAEPISQPPQKSPEASPSTGLTPSPARTPSPPSPSTASPAIDSSELPDSPATPNPGEPLPVAPPQAPATVGIGTKLRSSGGESAKVPDQEQPARARVLAANAEGRLVDDDIRAVLGLKPPSKAPGETAREEVPPSQRPYAVNPGVPIVPLLPFNSNLTLLFPLILPSPITSNFGWRFHPIAAEWRFHTGIDLGADYGTPVVAALPGRVVTAGWVGGYGWTVVLENAEGTQQTLYAHLSEMTVREGDWIKPGYMVGRVGSSGMATGPHLHFEVRQLTPVGWVPVDTVSQLEYASVRLTYARLHQISGQTLGATDELANGLTTDLVDAVAMDLTALDLLATDLIGQDLVASGMDLSESVTLAMAAPIIPATKMGSKVSDQGASLDLSPTAASREMSALDLVASELIAVDLALADPLAPDPKESLAVALGSILLAQAVTTN